jgi:two-component system phosphate regulon sensor histidine kinase PhoR
MWLFNSNLNLFIFICIGCTVTVVSFFVFYNLLNYFIYRKIKLIYKNIHQLKTSKGSIRNKINNDDTILKKVEDDVSEWATKYINEVTNLQEQEAYRSRFVSNVAHELKTPIFSIQGFLNSILDTADFDEKFARNFIEKAIKNADRLENIVLKLLQISKYENNDIALKIQNHNLEQVIKNAIELVLPLANNKHIKIVFKEGNPSKAMVACDADAIIEVLENILINAIKYSDDHNDIVVGWYDMGAVYLVEIMDHGIGISVDKLPFIFDRFYRVDTDRSRQKGGTGLGLSICKHIVEAHQQSIHARSALGKGSTLSFTLSKTTID